MKIVVLDGFATNPGDLSWSALEALGEVVIYDRTHPSKIAECIGDADVVLTNKAPVTATTLETCKNIKYIGVLATGYNIVDVSAAKERNILVSNIPTYGTAAVAQFAIALLLEICHHAGAHNDMVKDGSWERCEDWCFWNYPLIELANKTMGLIGFGRIGQATGRIANALGMNVIAYDPQQSDSGHNIGKYVSLDQLLENSDVISLHCPLLPSTEGIINKDNIMKMKDGVIIINNSRGPLIVEQDLADALNCGKVYAAAVDVVSKEPIVATNPLLKAKNCLITPHISWATTESRKRLIGIAVENLRAFLSGNPVNIVNF